MLISFRSNAARLSKLVRDEIMPATEEAVYWIEHVLRHSGAQHLEISSLNMPFYQRYLLDVTAFLISVCCASVFFTYKFMRYIRSLIAKPQKRKIN